MAISLLTLATGFLLILIGVWGILIHKNLIRMIVGFSLIDTGVHIVMVSLGYIRGGTAPIIDSAVDSARHVVDPVPSALVLTAIVIGLGVTAVMLSYVVRLYKHKKSLSIDDYAELKW